MSQSSQLNDRNLVDNALSWVSVGQCRVLFATHRGVLCNPRIWTHVLGLGLTHMLPTLADTYDTTNFSNAPGI